MGTKKTASEEAVLHERPITESFAAVIAALNASPATRAMSARKANFAGAQSFMRMYPKESTQPDHAAGAQRDNVPLLGFQGGEST